MHLPKTTLFGGLVVCSLVAVLAAGCGGSKKSASTTTTAATTTSAAATGTTKVAVVNKVAVLVPAKDKSKTLAVAADATYAPNEFIGPDGHTVVGMDADLANALAGVMGVKVKVVNATFATIIPGLQSGKYDLGMSSFTDTKQREKVVDFVTYFSAGTAFYTKTGGPTINTLADLCGHTVAVERGTTQEMDASAQNGKCKKAGKKGVTVHVYDTQTAANLAISSGRAEVGMADSPVAAYIVKQSNGQFKLTGKPYNTAPYGIALPKGNGMAKPTQAALQALIKDGTYKKLLTKWNVQQGAITTSEINPAVG